MGSGDLITEIPFETQHTFVYDQLILSRYRVGSLAAYFLGVDEKVILHRQPSEISS